MLNEERYIKECVESIVSSDIPKDNFEVIFVDGGSGDRSVDIVDSYIDSYPYIRLLSNPKKFTPISMNIGIRASMGDYIFVLSSHAKYNSSYFSKLVYYIKELKAQCVGGVLTTDVKNRTPKSDSIKEVLQSRFGVGNADFRTGSKEIKSVDTVAFGCYTKESFEKFGLYDERLIRNQDIELNKRIVNGGGKIYLIPKVESIYYARENFKELAKNNYSNGFWNILTAYYTKTLSSLSLRHFIPLIFVLSLIIPSMLSLVYPQAIAIAILSSVSYLSLVIIISFKLKNRTNSIFYLIVSFLTLHLSYGWGSIMGILKVMTNRG
jgi:glycosyltransferase involved in cell wall biosynthesis